MKKYYGIDWLRAIGCLGIAAMHMKVNNNYEISGFVYDRVVLSFTDFVYLFMAVSAFGMCCGYYDRVMNGKVDWENFYKKRYIKILPFFALLIVIDLISSFSVKSLLEGFTELTLLHGFIPNDLKVIGVGWFLGTVFVFYMIFPFFCVILKSKTRTWIATIICMGLNLICTFQFELNRHNFVSSLCFFLAGGLVYIYRDKIEKVKWQYLFVIMITAIVVYYINVNVLSRMLLTGAILAFAINAPLPPSKLIKFISGISMEIYLCHMAMFRVLEKLYLNIAFGNGVLQYLITLILVFVCACAFSYVAQTLIGKLLIGNKKGKEC